MEDRNFFKNMYDDFFGIEKIKKENEKISEELGLNKEVPYIDMKDNKKELNLNINSNINSNKNVKEEKTKEQKDKKLKEIFQKIDELYISDESKNTFKKIIEYMRKYYEKIEKNFIPFNIIVYSNDDKEIEKIAKILFDGVSYFEYIKLGNDVVEISLYNLEKLEQIEDIYSNKNSVILLKGLDAIVSQDVNYKDKFWHKIEEKIKENNNITIINAKNIDELNLAFDKNIDMKDKYFNFEIFVKKPEVQDVYNEVKEELEKENKLSEKFIVELLDYIEVTYPNSNLSYTEYKNKLIQEILFNKKGEITEEALPKYEKAKTINEIFEELNSLVGLKKVKKALYDLVDLKELQAKTNDKLNFKNTNLHMVFLGNPGTGKTTVARLVANILYQLKYIKQNKLIEVSSKDLVAEYVGQTAPKTMAVIEKALGGVLFIDEAYTLASGAGQNNSYNEEAIATLIQAMENNRDNLVVIFAGYTKEMQYFLNANSGIVSRIGYILEFEDYTEKELLKIFEGMVKKAGFKITDEALDEVLKIIKEYKNTKNFGNARFVRNLYEKTVIKHASNTKNKKLKKDLITIEKNDISTENLIKM